MALEKTPIINEQLDTLNELLETLNHLISHQNAAIDLIASDKRAELVSNLAEIAELVRADELLEVMDYGDQIVLPWKDGNTEITAPMNLCHLENAILEDGETMKVADVEWHYVLGFETVYDEPEAIYEAPAAGLAAGTYYFTIKNDSWGGNNDKIIQFTLSEALTEGQQIRKKSGAYNAAIENCTLGIFTSGADRTGTTLEFTVVNSSSGTNLGNTDGTNECNHWQRVVLGYNRWKTSAIRQFLNSTATAGNWWTSQNKWDVKPAYADTKDGFLHGYEENLLHYMQVTKVITAQNTITESGDMDETYDRVFLASLEQTYISPEKSGEGDYWEYYRRLLGRTTPASRGQTYARLIKYDVNARTNARYRWLRSASRGYAYNVWVVYSSGYVGNGGTHYGYRVAPCLRIGL